MGRAAGTVLAETRPGDTPAIELSSSHNALFESVFFIYSQRHLGHTTAFSPAAPAGQCLGLRGSALSSHLLRIQLHLLPVGELLSAVDGQVPPHLVGVLLALEKAERNPPAPLLSTPRRPVAGGRRRRLPAPLPGSGPASGTPR